MDANTYSDPQVIKLLQVRYITLKVDQDSRPDLSNRYEDFGWPATVVFDGNGHEIVKRQGYLAPEEMFSMLQAIIDDPTLGPSVQPERKAELPNEPLLTVSLREDLIRNFFKGYDNDHGSWGKDQKFLDWDSVEYAMNVAGLKNDTRAEHMARQTLNEQLHLLDPACASEPLHLTIVGSKDDPAAQSLFSAALRYPSDYKRLEWWDVREGRLPNPDVQYPQLKQAAAFICTNRTCSPPILNPDKLTERVDKLVSLR